MARGRATFARRSPVCRRPSRPTPFLNKIGLRAGGLPDPAQGAAQVPPARAFIAAISFSIMFAGELSRAPFSWRPYDPTLFRRG